MGQTVSKATLGRLPCYLEYVKRCDSENISATKIAADLGYGEVQVRKDLSAVCTSGRPKTGYKRAELEKCLSDILGENKVTSAVLVGAGKLGNALMNYGGFLEYGLEIIAAFDEKPDEENGVYPVSQLKAFCRAYDVKIGILTVPAKAADSVAKQMTESGITAIWNFAPTTLNVPQYVKVKNENLALSLAYLNKSII